MLGKSIFYYIIIILVFSYSAKRIEDINNICKKINIKHYSHYKTAKEFLEKALTDDYIHIFKIGKNIKEAICSDECVPIEIDEFLNDLDGQFGYDISNKKGNELAKDYLNSLDDFLNPGQYIKR